MQKLAIQALQHKYQAEMADAEFVFQVYMDRPVGVGEHPGLQTSRTGYAYDGDGRCRRRRANAL